MSQRCDRIVTLPSGFTTMQEVADIFTEDQHRWEAVKRAGLAALIKAAEAIPGVGSVMAGAGTFYQEWTKTLSNLPGEAREIVQSMANDLEAFLKQEGDHHASHIVGVALVEVLAILDKHGLSSDELVTTAGLDADKAARCALDQAKDKLRLLDADIESLVRRVVKEYYCVLLKHNDAMSHVGVPALQALLDMSSCLIQITNEIREVERVRAWRNMRWPVRAYDPSLGLRPLMLRAEYRIVPYNGEQQKETLEDLLGWVRGLEEKGIGHKLGLRLYVGSGGAGKTRLLIEAGDVLRRNEWIVNFLADASATRDNAHYFLDTDRPTLLILDYAGARSNELEALLTAMAEHRYRKDPFALVLLERTKPSWLQSMVRSSSDPQYAGLGELSVLGTMEEEAHDVPILIEKDRVGLFNQAVRSFQQILNAVEEWGIPTPNPLPEHPLYVLLLVLLALAGEKLNNTADEQEILERTWARERKMWQRQLLAEGLPSEYEADVPNVIEELLVAITLGHSFASSAEVAEFLKAHVTMPTDPRGTPLDAVWLAKRMLSLFPAPVEGKGSYLALLIPDPLTDWFVTGKLAEQDSPSKYLEKLLSSSKSEEYPVAAAFILHRCLALPRLLIEDKVMLRNACQLIDSRLSIAGQRDLINGLEQRVYGADPSIQASILRSFFPAYDSNIPIGQYIHEPGRLLAIVQENYQRRTITQEDSRKFLLLFERIEGSRMPWSMTLRN